MDAILVDYVINEKTMIVLPTAHLHYQSIVWETNRILYVQKTPLQLIQQACIEGGADYAGRRISMIYHTNAKQKTPIPINPTLNIYAFPTESPNNFNCKWIFYNHVLSIERNQSATKSTYPSIIIFKNGQTLPITESLYLLDKQRQRTAMCMSVFNPNIKTFLLHDRNRV
ncbi:competence protein [Bacillus sp. HMF5848]|uniref:competence protein ComK n=1 Tax=Bacillus sp. HMF5848 TaxID=2495421 RepID=UPI000F79190E|nr:competence protein ComK [Bacillus sp. HMF5848]RSK28840.1 competence protein [Bacillus sp. HMF5848]